MAATNLPELLDSALTRPGRFDRQASAHRARLGRLQAWAGAAARLPQAAAKLRPHAPQGTARPPCAVVLSALPCLHSPPVQVAVTLPDVKGRQQILDLYLAGKPVAADVDTGELPCACVALRVGFLGWRLVGWPQLIRAEPDLSLLPTRRLCLPLLCCRHPGTPHPWLQRRRAGQPGERGGPAGSPPRQRLRHHPGGPHSHLQGSGQPLLAQSLVGAERQATCLGCLLLPLHSGTCLASAASAWVGLGPNS